MCVWPSVDLNERQIIIFMYDFDIFNIDLISRKQLKCIYKRGNLCSGRP